MKIIDIENSFFEDLRCAICKNYLIHFPICACSDGRMICANCEPECGDCSKPYPTRVLETFIKNAKFSCQFEESGCDTILSLDFIKEHEGKCTYRPGKCMGTACKWSGLMVDLNKHFRETHQCANNTDITLSISGKSSASAILLALVESVPFVIEYSYDANTVCLSYKILYVSDHIKEAKYKITAGEKILKEGECVSFVNSSCTLNSHLDNLDKISTATNFSLNIKIAYTKYEWCTLDSTKLDLLICAECREYLIPCAYDYQQLKFICGSCAENNHINVISKHSINELIKNTYFACKWNDCCFVSNALNVFNHQKTCRFQTYICRLLAPKECETQGNFDSIKTHLQNVHQCIQFNVEYSGSPDFTIFTLQHGSIIVVKCYRSFKSVIVTVSNLDGRVENNKLVYVQFQHDHCRLKTKWFSVSSEFIVKEDEVPLCFNFEKQFTVTVKTMT